MQGSIRFFLGLALTMSAVGGMDAIPDQLLTQLAVALAGLLLMWWGSAKMIDKRPQNRYN